MVSVDLGSYLEALEGNLLPGLSGLLAKFISFSWSLCDPLSLQASNGDLSPSHILNLSAFLFRFHGLL